MYDNELCILLVENIPQSFTLEAKVILGETGSQSFYCPLPAARRTVMVRRTPARRAAPRMTARYGVR